MRGKREIGEELVTPTTSPRIPIARRSLNNSIIADTISYVPRSLLLNSFFSFSLVEVYNKLPQLAHRVPDKTPQEPYAWESQAMCAYDSPAYTASVPSSSSIRSSCVGSVFAGDEG